MASSFKKKQKRHLIAAIVCCVLVLAVLVASVAVACAHRSSLYQKFEDRDFAAAIAQALGLSSKYSLDQEDLDKYEGLVYFCSVGVDTNNKYSSYAYPVVMLCDKTYTDLLIEESDPGHEPATEKDETDYSSHYIAVPYVLSDPEDLNLFTNLRMLRAFDISEINEMASGCQMTQIYSMYGLGTQAVSVNTLIDGTRLSGLNDLHQISSLTKLEHLSLCYSGITSLDGLENFPNLTKLDITSTAVTDISALSSVPNLSYLSLNSLNETKKDESGETSGITSGDTSDTSADTSSDTSSEASDDKDDDKEEKKEPTYNETGLTSEQLSVLSNLKNLTYLDITNNYITDLSALSTLQNMEYLSLANNPLEKLTGTENMKSLKVLYATDCRLTGLDELQGADKLESAYLSNNKLSSLNGLSASTAMTSLDASGNELTDASAVAGMKDLETLNLSDNRLTKAPDLSALKKTTGVDLSKNELTDASGLEKFNPTEHEVEKDDQGNDKAITLTLNLSGNKLSKLSLSASKLTSLDLTDNQLGLNAEGAALHFDGCTALTTLTVNDNATLQTLEGIETLTELTTLNAKNSTLLTNIPALKELKKLATVDLSGSKALKTLEGLKDCEALSSLTLSECERLTDLTAVSTLKKLSTLNLDKCTELTNESITNAFGTPKTDTQEANLLMDKAIKMTVTLTGCTKVTDFKIFDEYGSITLNRDKAASAEK